MPRKERRNRILANRERIQSRAEVAHILVQNDNPRKQNENIQTANAQTAETRADILRTDLDILTNADAIQDPAHQAAHTRVIEPRQPSHTQQPTQPLRPKPTKVHTRRPQHHPLNQAMTNY